MQRAGRIAAHLKPHAASAKSDDDIVVVSAIRTPITRARKGGFRDTQPDALLAAVLAETVKRHPTAKVADIVVGNVLQGGAGALTSRMAQLCAGISEDVPLMAINRQCSSGLQAFANVAGSISAGMYDFGIAAGVESMSKGNMMDAAPKEMNPAIFDCEAAQDCMIPMGITSENVAEKFNVSRESQDALAAASHNKAERAQANGWFKEEIIPVATIQIDKDGEEVEVTVSEDDGIRKGMKPEALSKLKPAFAEGGCTTAGNSSQTSDGAAAVLVARRSAAVAAGLPIIGKFKSFAVKGCPPDIMGIGPAVAIPAALQKAGMSIDDIDIFEVNEAFASQAVYCVDHLKIPRDKVNPKGGAIALGHPLGCTGARQISTLLHELRRTGKKTGVISMCIGTGMGAAAVFEAE
jgi:acetyl-CoA acyltransferase 1